MNSSEDKTCRICGYADQSNLNIFQNPTTQIQKKILALYPIVLYKSDPLPKNICLKCYSNTLRRYDEHQRINKIQIKWINNVRNNQPNNPYIKILDKIYETNKVLLENFKRINNESLELPIMRHNRGHFPEDISSFKTNHQLCSQIGFPHSQKILLNRLKEGEKVIFNKNNFPKNRCRLCFKLFPNQKYLAYHQMKYHLDLSVFKSFTKKSLAKRFRSGHVIKINDKNCLRCSNCWKCYDSYDSILNHWKNKHCEFFCLICGKEYYSNPSYLRKHIRFEHELEFKAYEIIKEKTKDLKITSKSKDISSFKQLKKNEDSDDCSVINSLKKESFEFININEKPKIPVLKLKRKTNSEKEEFDIKIEDRSCSPTFQNDVGGKPLLRVKNISELQSKPKYDNEDYVDLDELKLNIINLENNNPNCNKQNLNSICN